MSRLTVAVIGGGPAGLMAAEVLSKAGIAVTVFERMPSLGRKFLMAGRGGLNLTHSEPLDAFLLRYGERREQLEPAIAALTPEAIRAWCEGLAQPTFVGSSGRVFPRAMKASPLLRAWLQRLAEQGVRIATRHRWTGWDAAGRLAFDTPDGPVVAAPDATILALGGASWPRLGADGGWVERLQAAGIAVAPLAPSNVGLHIDWTAVFRERFAGHPLKRIALRHVRADGGRSVQGEAVVTRSGIEGGAVYTLSPALRDAIAADGSAVLRIDLKPDLTVETLAERLARPKGKQSLTAHLRRVAVLPPVAIGLLHEVAIKTATPLSQRTPAELATLIKALPLTLTATASLDKAISTAGGIRFDELDAGYMLTRRPGVFAAGEMLDWEAPTGGYLLQACFATGAAAAHGALAWLLEQV